MKKRRLFICFLLFIFICGCGEYAHCYCCGESTGTDDPYSVDDQCFCDDCYSNLKNCLGCGEKFIENCEIDELPYCSSCYYSGNYVKHCAWCGELKSTDDITDYNEDNVCYRCLYVHKDELCFSSYDDVDKIIKLIASASTIGTEQYYKAVGEFYTNNACVISPSGEKYHRLHCHHILESDEYIILNMATAEERGYEACNDCY